MSEMTIVTYGGGEILYQLFTGIKFIFDSGMIKSLCYLMASLTALYALFNAYFSSNPDSLVKHFFIPILALVVLCFSVKTTVYIEDVLPLSQGGINLVSKEAFNSDNKNVGHEGAFAKQVDGVPFLIGFIAKGISTIGHRMTVAVEDIFHTNDDDKYTKTGIIFGAETALDMNEIVINDGDLDCNLKTFCHTCMLYDLAYGYYTLNDLKNESNLLEFLKDRTGKGRYMNYISSGKEVKSSWDLVSCEMAIEKMTEKLAAGGVEVAHQQKKQIFRHLPVAYQALTKKAGDSAEIIKQMLVMSVVTEEMSSDSFAAKRAALQQKTSWKTVGGIADGLVVTTRCVIEALIYGAIIFVIPMMFLPSGFSYLKTWVWLLVWIQLWPPFYVILDYVSLIAARGQAEGFFDPESAGTCCLTIYNTIGLSNIYGNISAYAKSMKILIPPLSYAILQGGVGSFVHLTSSMMGTSQQAASMAASDEVSGNYSFANTTMDTSGFSNATYGQQNFAPALASGYIKQDSLRGSTLYGHGDSNIQENLSKFSFGLSEDSAVQASLAETVSSTQTAHEASTNSLSSSMSNTGRATMDYTRHLANDSSYSIANSTSTSQDYSKSAQFCENQVDTFAKDHNMSVQDAWEVFSSVSGGTKIPFVALSAGISARQGHITTNTFSDALSMSETSEFREAYNDVINHATNYSHNETDGEGYRLANSLTGSIDKMTSSSEAFSATFDKVNQASETANFYSSHSFTERMDLNQQFLDFAVEDRGWSVNQFKDLIHSDNRSNELTDLISDFSSARMPEAYAPQNYVEPEASHFESVQGMPDFNPEIDKEFVLRGTHDFSGSSRDMVEEKLEGISNYSEKIEQTREDTRNERIALVNPPSLMKKPGINMPKTDYELAWSVSFDEWPYS